MSVSAQFKQNIYPPHGVGRKTVAEVTYQLTAPDSKEGGNTVLPEGNVIARPWQVMNEIRLQQAPVGTLEPDHWTLEGRFMIPVPPNEQEHLEIGHWSKTMSDEDGYFETPLIFERYFDSVQTFNALVITFDVESGNCAADFDVEFYDGFGGLIHKEEVRDNQETTYTTPRAGLDILHVVVRFHKTNRSYRFLRIVEIDFGIVLTYLDSDIASINLIRQGNYRGRSFIYPELRLSIFNQGKYNILDETTFAPYFLRRQRFTYRHGLELPDGTIEWVDCGTYFLHDWEVSDKRVIFTAKGRTSWLTGIPYRESSFTEFSLQQLARQFYPQTDISLISPLIPGYFGHTNYRQALAQLVEFSSCMAYETRNNRVQFLDILEQGKEVVDTIDYSNSKLPRATLNQFYNAILLTEYDVSIEHRQISRTTHSAGDIMVVFNQPAQGELEFEITDGYRLDNPISRTMYMTGQLVRTHDNAPPQAELTIRGEVITLTGQDNLYHAPWHTGREETNIYAVDLPFFIRTASQYTQMRDWFLERKFRLLRKQIEVNSKWRGNPAREVGDFVDMAFDNQGRSQGMDIVTTEMRYSGGLHGFITTIGDNPLFRGEQNV